MSQAKDTLLRLFALLRLIPTEPQRIATPTLLEKLRERGFSMTLRSIQRDLNRLSIPFSLQCNDSEVPLRWSFNRGQGVGPAQRCRHAGVHRFDQDCQATNDLLRRIEHEARLAGSGVKSPNIVFTDAPDLQAAAESAASAIAFNQGEVCTAGSRLLVERSIKDKFLPMVVEALKTWKPGNPLDPATNVGALVDTQQMNNVLSYIESDHTDGANLVAGGKRIFEETVGTYVKPTIFEGVNNAMKIDQKEIFGPVLSVITFDTVEEAINIANDSPYGLGAEVWTADIFKAHLTAKAPACP